MAVTLINSFKVPLDQEEAFLSGWKETSAALVSKVEFLEAHLHRNTEKSGQEFLYVNVALWETAEDLINADPKLVSDANRLPGVQAFPGILEEVITLPRQLPH